MTLEDIGMKRCRCCRKDLPLEDFYLQSNSPDGHRNICKYCYIERQQKRVKHDPEYVVKHRPKKEMSPEERERRRLYAQVYREQHRDQCNEASKLSNRIRRSGEVKFLPGPVPAETVAEAEAPKREASFPLGTRKPQHADRSCNKCVNYPCFKGIENLESDFAAEGCHGYHQRGEAS